MNVYISKPVVISDMQGPCAEGFHIPSKDDWDNIKGIMETLNISSPAEYSTYLHIPLCGCRAFTTGNVSDVGGYARYTSSYGRVLSGTNKYAYTLTMWDTNVSFGYGNPSSSGLSIRPFKNVPVSPDSSWTALYSNKIYHNSSLGLISLSSDGTNWITMSDKNLGATAVYNNGDTMSETNCGKYYQRGNNYGFPFTGSITTSSTKVDTSAYGPGNYYSSSTFIAGDTWWDSSNNLNIRGGETRVGGQFELKNAYIGEYIPPYLCFTANTANSTVKLNKNGTPASVTLETSTDGTNWATYSFGTTITLTNIGDKVYFRNTSETDTLFSTSSSNYYQFVMTGSISGSGDVNYLLNKNSTTTLSSYCYYYLFRNCTSLATAPSLPATTLAERCYAAMFTGCTGLTTAPALPVTTLATRCYNNMFFGCTGLTTAPALPATTLAETCYAYMFSGCTSLTTLPSLPALTLTNSCYIWMFNGCSKIKLSTTQTGEYQTAYRIPKTGTGTVGSYSLSDMFGDTGGTFTGAPSINTTYYTSNTVV